jgi:hypothetical protein
MGIVVILLALSLNMNHFIVEGGLTDIADRIGIE